MKEDWVPKWSAEMRLPAFAAVRHLMPFGGKKYLYGNAPAFDCLKLEANEGLQYEQDIHLLFAGKKSTHLHPASSVVQLTHHLDSLR